MDFSKSSFLCALFCCSIVVGGCHNDEPVNSDKALTTSSVNANKGALRFADVTAQAGIKFNHNNAAFGLRFLPETMGSGVAFIDFDGDGYQDLFFVNGRDWTQSEVEAYRTRSWSEKEIERRRRVQPSGPLVREIPARSPRRRTTGALYHNNGDGTFRDVTKGSGLDVEMQGMGAAVGDYDNDGKPDLFVTSLGRNFLFHNEGRGRFRDVALRAGVGNAHWSTSAAWLDYDTDGRLDLFVCEYVHWTILNDVYATYDGVHKGYTRPDSYEGLFSHLYHNDGARFSEVSNRAGICGEGTDSPLLGRGLGVAICDYNDDGWSDIVVANDLKPNFLFRNNKNSTFSEVGQACGLAYGPLGKARAGMGIDAADIDHSGRASLVIGNFSDEMLGLYYNQGNGLFTDIVPNSNMAAETFSFLTFGCLFFDFDNDGWLDIMAANGHLNPEMDFGGTQTTYAERPLLFHNRGVLDTSYHFPQFDEVGLQCGEALQYPLVGRGLATADIDLDGDQDVIISCNGHEPHLLRNDGGNRNNGLRLVLQGTKSNRSAIGAIVQVKVGKETQHYTVKSGSSYLSQSELPLTVGLGQQSRCEILIRWPSGKQTRFLSVPGNQILWVSEEVGTTRRQTFNKSRAN